MIGLDKLITKDMAIAGAMLQRDTPLPARFMRRGFGVRQQRLSRLAADRERAISWQPFRPILIAIAKRLTD